MTTPDTEPTALEFLTKLAKVAEVVAWQAGVGGMETAGSLVSYLARFPEKLPAFMADDFSVVSDLPANWLIQGCLTWHAQNGRVVTPEFVRRAEVIRKLGDSHHA